MPDEATIKHAAAPRTMPGATASDVSGSGFWLNSWPLVVAGLVGVALLALTGMLWAHYGTAVFYETILAGLAACF